MVSFTVVHNLNVLPWVDYASLRADICPSLRSMLKQYFVWLCHSKQSVVRSNPKLCQIQMLFICTPRFIGCPPIFKVLVISHKNIGNVWDKNIQILCRIITDTPYGASQRAAAISYPNNHVIKDMTLPVLAKIGNKALLRYSELFSEPVKIEKPQLRRVRRRIEKGNPPAPLLGGSKPVKIGQPPLPHICKQGQRTHGA